MMKNSGESHSILSTSSTRYSWLSTSTTTITQGLTKWVSMVKVARKLHLNSGGPMGFGWRWMHLSWAAWILDETKGEWWQGFCRYLEHWMISKRDLNPCTVKLSLWYVGRAKSRRDTRQVRPYWIMWTPIHLKNNISELFLYFDPR